MVGLGVPGANLIGSRSQNSERASVTPSIAKRVALRSSAKRVMLRKWRNHSKGFDSVENSDV